MLSIIDSFVVYVSVLESLPCTTEFLKFWQTFMITIIHLLPFLSAFYAYIQLSFAFTDLVGWLVFMGYQPL